MGLAALQIVFLYEKKLWRDIDLPWCMVSNKDVPKFLTMKTLVFRLTKHKAKITLQYLHVSFEYSFDTIPWGILINSYC